MRPGGYWLAGALAFNALFTARAMAPAFGHTIQDDALQHVFWVLRYRDSELFRDDLFADYFESVAPVGYAAIYWMLTRAMDPFVASKLLPPLLGCTAAIFTFLLVRRLHPLPAAAFLATVLASWYTWQYDDVVSATPRAFSLPVLTALVWSLAAGRLALGVALTTLAALLYPFAGVLGVALLAMHLVRFERGSPAFTRRWSTWLAVLSAGALVGMVLLPRVLGASPYGPTVTADQARAMPEFGRGGRNAFFVDGAYQFWLAGNGSGLNLRVRDALFPGVPILFEYAALAALLPLLVGLRGRLPSARLISGQSSILLRLVAASFALFFLSHLLLFHLYLPSRYVQWSVPLTLAIVAGLVLAILFQEVASRIAPARRGRLVTALALMFASGVALYPAGYRSSYQPDPYPAITAYLRTQPKDVLVAAPPVDADVLAGMTGRRVLVAREYALAFHLGYYGEVRQRIKDLIDGYYDEGTKRLAFLVERYGVDFFLVDHYAFDATTYQQSWSHEFDSLTGPIRATLARRRRYALQDLARDCAVVDEGRIALVPATCLRTAAAPPS